MPASVPNIVGTYSAFGQTASIATTTIYTPSTNGLFRASVSCVRNSGSGTATSLLGWTDGSGSRSYSVADYYYDTVMEVNNQPITIGVTVAGTVNYDIWVVIEQLA